MKRRTNLSILTKLIMLSGVILVSFGVIGFLISNHFISKAKEENLPHRGRPKHHFADPGGFERGHPERHREEPPRFRGPQVWGMTPEGVNSLIFAFSIILGFLCCTFMLVYYSRKTASIAEDVLKGLKEGDLARRFPVSLLSSKNSIANQFNEMADEIENLVKDIEEREKVKNATFQELAHDIRTPVTGLMSLIESIHEYHETMSKEQLKEFSNSSLSECRYIGRLVEDLLFISGVEQVKYLESFVEVDLVDIIRNEVSLFSAGQIEFSETQDLKNIKGNAYLLQRLVRNSLENATSFSKNKVCIEIREDAENDYIISIQDDGPGLTQEALEAYGEKSFSRKERNLGNQNKRLSIGLGSFIIKKIAKLHSGDIEIQNRIIDNQVVGATLSIRLPRYF